MSRVIDAFPFERQPGRKWEPRDYEQWFDGRVHELSAGEDFTGTARNFARQIRRAADVRDYALELASSDVLRKVWVQVLHDAR